MKRIHVIVFAVAAAVVMIGCSFIYCFGGGHDAKASYSDGKISYSLDSAMPEEFTYIVYSNTNVPEKLYLYFDPNEGYEYSDSWQKALLEPMERLLKDRGMKNIEWIDSAKLKEKIDSDSEHDSAVLFYTGKIPAAIAADGLSQWMSEGNTIYWIGPGLKPLLGDNVNSVPEDISLEERKKHNGTIQSEFAKANSVGFIDCCYGMKKGYGLDIGYSNESYSSISVKSWSSGRLMVIGNDIHPLSGGDLPSLQEPAALAGYIASGITEDSQMLEWKTVSKGYFGFSGTIDITPVGDTVFYISVGRPYSQWAKAIEVA